MEHKPSSAVRKRTVKVEPCHYCGTCSYYAEMHQEGEEWIHHEYCNAGKTYDEIRHSLNCDRWEVKA